MSLNFSWGSNRAKSRGAPQIGPSKTGTTAGTANTTTAATIAATHGTDTAGAAVAVAAGGVAHGPEAGEKDSGRETIGVRGAELVEGGGRGRRRRSDGGLEEKEEKEKPAAARIGEVLSRLPLSKLKIVVGEWTRLGVSRCFFRKRDAEQRGWGRASRWISRRANRRTDQRDCCFFFHCFCLFHPPIPWALSPLYNPFTICL